MFFWKIMSFHNPFHMKITMFYALPLKPIKIFYKVNEVAWLFGIYLCIAIEDDSSTPSYTSWNKWENTPPIFTCCMKELSPLEELFPLRAEGQAKVPNWARIVDHQITGFTVGLSCYGQALYHCLPSAFLSSCTT